MDVNLVGPLLDWTAAHPGWAGALVFLIAMSESLALVGLFMPGAVLMFGIGALVGTGALELWPTLGAAAIGAAIGDGVSFWLGRHFHQRLRVIWPFRTHPGLVARATDFFYNHGGKSVLLGRFVGPLRPVIPAVAGMLDMPAGRFFAVNLLSALLWAPAYLLPGMVFAASLGLAAEVAGRLALFAVLLAGLLLATIWAARRTFDLLHPRAHAILAAVLRWSRGHPVVGELPAAVIDPEHPEARGLTVLAVMLLLATGTFAFVVRHIAGDEGLFGLDGYVHTTLQQLRTPPIDRLMVAVTGLGDGLTLLSVFGAVGAWLAVRRRWQALGHWLGAVGFIWIATRALKLITHLPRPITVYEGVSAFSFPSGHTTNSVVMFGFLAVLIGHEVPDMFRRLLYTMAAVAISLVAFSRLYLGAHWLSDVIGGIALGSAWIALLGIAYRRHRHPPLAPVPLLTVAVAATLAGALWTSSLRFDQDLRRYAPPAEPRMEMTSAEWWNAGWRKMAAYRSRAPLTQTQPMTVQYAGDPAPLRSVLADRGWTVPPELDAASWLRWFGSDDDTLPLLPQFHEGHAEALLMIRRAEDGRLAVLRLWPAAALLEGQRQGLYVGYAAYLATERTLGLIMVPRTLTEFDRPLMLVRNSLGGDLQWRSVERSAAADMTWNGGVLLVRRVQSESSFSRIDRSVSSR